MEFRKQLPIGLFVLTLLPAPVLACTCAPGSMGFCQALPDTSNANHAVFVGKVTEFYPKSPAERSQLLEEFIRTHPDLLEALRAQSPEYPTGRRIAGASSGNLEWRKQIIKYIWGDTLTPTEQEQLRVASDERELDRLGFDQRRRARLEVLENFTGADAPQFTLYTALDGPGCGFDFAEGGTYLVEAYKTSGSDKWRVSSCSRTRLLGQAAEDLKTLRAWKTGQRLPGYITGQIVDRRNPLPGTAFQLRLLGGKQILETTSDSSGRFGFENLDAGVYQVQVVQPTVVSRSADLTHAWCALVIVPLGP
jgi:hypothetical protein